MADGDGSTTLTGEGFKDAFASLVTAILKQWPALDREALLATDGDLDRVVTLVADKTQSAAAAVRATLGELKRETASASPPGVNAQGEGTKERVVAMIDRLEKKTADLVKELRGTSLDVAKTRMRENLLITVLVAIGLGFLVGLVFGGFGRGRR